MDGRRVARRVLGGLALAAAVGAVHPGVPSPALAAHVWQDWLAELPLLAWAPVVEGQTLEPWDMLWVQRDGRVELEIVREIGPPLRDEAHDVLAPDGSRTNRKRFPGDSYVVVHPRYWLEVRVTKVIGDVWVATERDRVEAFYLAHRSRQAVWGWTGAEDQSRWREALAEPELR
jgi:hypothetical protein